MYIAFTTKICPLPQHSRGSKIKLGEEHLKLFQAVVIGQKT